MAKLTNGETLTLPVSIETANHTGSHPMKLRKQVGPAIWLLLLLWRFAPRYWDRTEWVIVAKGNFVTDAELGKYLDAKPGTVAKWRLRLRRHGLVRWITKVGYGMQFAVYVPGDPLPREPSVNPTQGAELKDLSKWVH